MCKRELEIRNFVPLAYFEVVATAKVAGGQFQMRHAPQDRIVRREIAEDVVKAAEGFEGALAVRVEDKRQGPPKLHDLPSLQKLCGSRFGWSASKTLEVAQELYDGQGKKIITYPRAEVRYLPAELDIGRAADRGRTAGGPIVQRDPRARAAGHPQGRERHASTTRDWKARAITPSFPTSTRSTNCRRSGLVCRRTRRNCSTSSRGPIWPP